MCVCVCGCVGVFVCVCVWVWVGVGVGVCKCECVRLCNITVASESEKIGFIATVKKILFYSEHVLN